MGYISKLYVRRSCVPWGEKRQGSRGIGDNDFNRVYKKISLRRGHSSKYMKEVKKNIMTALLSLFFVTFHQLIFSIHLWTKVSLRELGAPHQRIQGEFFPPVHWITGRTTLLWVVELTGVCGLVLAPLCCSWGTPAKLGLGHIAEDKRAFVEGLVYRGKMLALCWSKKAKQNKNLQNSCAEYVRRPFLEPPLL